MRPALDRSPASDLPRNPGRHEGMAVAALALLVTAGLLVNLGIRPLEFEEPRRALVALEMALRGNLIVPTTNGNLYLNKPPVFNWVLLAFMRLFGSDAAWVLRLPTALSMLGLSLAFFCVARRHLPRSTALTGTAFLLTFPTLLFYGSLYGEIDVFYALLVAVQALAIFSFERSDRPLALFVVSYLLAAAGVLTKGVPSLAFQALTLVAWLPLAGKRRWLFSWQHLAGLAAFAVCVGGYFAAYSRYADPAPFLARLLFESTDRTAAGGAHGLGRIAVQLARFPLQLASLCAPWVAFAPGLFGREARAHVRSTPFLQFCVVFLLVNVLPYWLSPGNRPRYMFPFLPFLAALLAVASEHLAERGWYAGALRWLLGLALSAAPVFMAVLPFTRWGASLSHLWLWLAVMAFVAALAMRYWRAGPARSRLALVLLAVAAARVGYDLVVHQVRREQGRDSFLEKVGSVLAREYRDRPIQLLGAQSERVQTVPLIGRSFTYREWEWFPFTLVYRYTADRSELLRYALATEPGKLYLAHVDFPVSGAHEVLRVFDAPGDDQDLKLILVRE